MKNSYLKSNSIKVLNLMVNKLNWIVGYYILGSLKIEYTQLMWFNIIRQGNEIAKYHIISAKIYDFMGHGLSSHLRAPRTDCPGLYGLSGISCLMVPDYFWWFFAWSSTNTIGIDHYLELSPKPHFKIQTFVN